MIHVVEDLQLHHWVGNQVHPTGGKSRAAGSYVMDGDVLCFRNAKGKVFRAFVCKPGFHNDPTAWLPYSTALSGGYNGVSAFELRIARVSWVVGAITLQTFGDNSLEKIVLVRDYATGYKTITRIEGADLFNFLPP